MKVSQKTHRILKTTLILLVFPVAGLYSYIAYVVLIKGFPQEPIVEAVPLEEPTPEEEQAVDTGPVGDNSTSTSPGITDSQDSTKIEVPETKEEISEWEEDFSDQPSNYGDF